MMKAKPAQITVQMPHELRSALEAIAVEKGETLSVIMRSLARQAVAEARRVDHGVPQIMAGAADLALKDSR